MPSSSEVGVDPSVPVWLSVGTVAGSRGAGERVVAALDAYKRSTVPFDCKTVPDFLSRAIVAMTPDFEFNLDMASSIIVLEAVASDGDVAFCVAICGFSQ